MRPAEEHHRTVREQLGAYVLGGLPAAEATGVLAHLDACPACRAEAASLARTAALLAAADPERLDLPPPPAWLGDRVVDAVALAASARTRRRRLVLAAAALLVAVAATTGLLVAARDGTGGQPASTPLTFVTVPAGVEVTGALERRPWGTIVRLEAEGLEPGRIYGAWLERDDGSRVSAGTFRLDEGRWIRCYLTSALAVHEAAAFGVSDPRGGTVLRAPLTGSTA